MVINFNRFFVIANGIDDIAFELLDAEAMKSIIPNLGQRLKFSQRYNQLLSSVSDR